MYTVVDHLTLLIRYLLYSYTTTTSVM